MAPPNDPSIPPGAWVLVTGVNGLVGSHVANQLLAHGYRVRGTVRSIDKNAWMVDYFDRKFGKGFFELAQVVDITKPGAFSDAVRGMAGVMHVASAVTFDPDPDQVIPVAVDSTIRILESAAGEASVERFVLTSSYSALVYPHPNQRIRVTTETWNEESVSIAKNLPKDISDGQKGFAVYCASKTKGEQAMWNWVKQNKPSFVVNSVLPGGNFGRVLDVKNQGYPSTTGLAEALYANKNKEFINAFVQGYAPEWFVDTEDCALLHVAALVRKDVASERVFAVAEPFNWNKVLQSLRRSFPDREFAEDVPGLYDDLAVIEPAARAEALLKDMGRDGFLSLDESLRREFAA